ncbi:FACT complex protein [Aureobasidium sp. EXF-12298]|nr:FACT complex protein [Aureobasidium sp. EXF-12298]KAI4754738.1 FACT complex protein [Aureobasidium sp. EXF-12344]KAI4768725.1 FACT complex protein [Aureobasidium sp. EXF-3400]
MADEVTIDKATFHNRLSAFISQWKQDKRNGDSLFAGASSIAIVMGKSDESQGFSKTSALQFWLLGYEFPSTVFVITQDSMHIVTTKKKATYLEPLKDGKTPVEILVRGKDAAENAKQFETCLDVIKNAGKKVGIISKDPSSGPFIKEWKDSFANISKDVEEVDITPAISAALSIKDEKELRAIRDASRASSGIMANYFVDQMSGILDEEKKMSHKALSQKVADKIEDDKFFQKLKVSSGFDPSQLDWSISPVVQSGGKYDLKLSAEADDSNLHAGVILSTLGLRYLSYCSIISRTYLVDPNKSQESAYKLLLAVHDSILKNMKDGMVAKDVYTKALGLIKSKKPELEKNFVKSVGYGIGIETRDSSFPMNGKNTQTLRDGMTFSITTGFHDIENPNPQDNKSKTYSLLLTDTVRVGGSEGLVFTKDAPSDLESTSFFFKDDEDEPEKAKPKPKKDSRVGAVAKGNITSTRLRSERSTQPNEEREAQRKDHQRELHSKKQQQGLDKYGEGTGNLNGTEVKKFKRFESYKRDNQFPSRVKDLIVLVDVKNASIILPIMGRAVPFHINTIKNVSQTEENAFSFLRINFLSPGQGVGRKDDQPFEDPLAHFLRSLTFRSKDTDRMNTIVAQITDMKKDAVRKEQEKKDLEDVVEQDKLVEIRNRRPQRLDNIFMRPSLESKRIGGSVEIHQNGLRYAHMGGVKVDVLFSNIKHLFFQPSQHELIVIIHCHLHNPIMIGKRKTKDIQFYREATEMQFDETGNRKRKHRYGDEEEFEAEQEERRRRVQLDKEFRSFAEKIADAGKGDNLQVDMPYRDLGFNGVPARSSVYIQPTTECLIQITEPPFTVITLNDIEIVHLERVQFGLKNFDMVIVFQDFQRPPVHINTIPVESLDSVKDWLDSIDTPYSEGPLNLNWGTIMKTVTADPHEFFAGGGWSFLAAESDDEGESEEEESAFEVSEEDLASDESSEDESDFDDDASADASEEEMSEDESGEDWDEMEEKAKKRDRESGLDEEESRPKAKGGKPKKR